MNPELEKLQRALYKTCFSWKSGFYLEKDELKEITTKAFTLGREEMRREIREKVTELRQHKVNLGLDLAVETDDVLSLLQD